MAGLTTLRIQTKKISIRNKTKIKLPLSQGTIKKLIEKTLRSLNESNGGYLDIVFLTDKEISKLNRKYLGQKQPTDVIAFGYPDKGADIAVSLDTVRKNARIYGAPLKKELTLCIIHGILHTLGYDDGDYRSAKRMFQKQEEILNKLSAKLKA